MSENIHFLNGERVVHKLFGPGVFLKYRSDELCYVRFDNEKQETKVSVCAFNLRRETPERNLERLTLSDKFRRNLDGYERRWETSYTKQCVDGVLAALGVTEISDVNPIEIRNALLLLKQYHADLHVPYEQRDGARAQVRLLQQELATVRASRLALIQKLGRIKAELL